jgi:uncharacterized protein YutE (UPF0331/DUF86 family)
VVDRERVLGKVAEVDGYLRELRSIAPAAFAAYRAVEKKRACERLLQIAIEAVLEICHLLVTGLRLGLPSEENDLFEKLARAGVLSDDETRVLKRMRGFRNILVHEYGEVDDEIVFLAVTKDVADIERFKQRILEVLRTPGDRA